jgi:hypothetical protein
LSRAIRETFGKDGVDVCMERKDLENVDVGCDEGFAKLLKVRAAWVHGAPPCKTFSSARRSDHFAKVKCLRTEERPQGFGSEAADVANKLALRMLEVARGQMARGVFFSIENPYSSLLWKLKQYVKLAAEKDVRLVRIHQCMAGSAHKKETGVLTNAPWLADLLCDSDSRPHHHVPLIGLVEDFRGEDSKQVFYTELAAEYPEGLCSLWAKGFHKYCKREAGGDRQRQRTAGHDGPSEAGGASMKRWPSPSSQIPQIAARRLDGPAEAGCASMKRWPSPSLAAGAAMNRTPPLRRIPEAGGASMKRWPSPSMVAGAATNRAPHSRLGMKAPCEAALSSGGGSASDIQRGDPLMTAKAG